LAQAQCYSGEESKLEGYASEIRSLSHSTATLKAGTSTKNWLVGWLMAWDVLVDIADVKTKCRVHFFGVKTWLVGWLVTPLRRLNIWPFFHSKQNHPNMKPPGFPRSQGRSKCQFGRLDTFCGWLQIFFPFQGGPVGPEDFAPNSGCRRFVVYIR